MNNPSYFTQTEESKNFNVKAAILAGLMIVGFGQLIVSGIDYYQRKEFSDFLQRAEKVEALVTKVNATTETNWSRSHSGHRTSTVTDIYLITIEFNFDGQIRKHVIKSSHPSFAPEGQVITAWIDKKKPYDVRVEGMNQSFMQIWVMRLIALGIALFFYVGFLKPLIVFHKLASTGILKQLSGSKLNIKE